MLARRFKEKVVVTLGRAMHAPTKSKLPTISKNGGVGGVGGLFSIPYL